MNKNSRAPTRASLSLALCVALIPTVVWAQGASQSPSEELLSAILTTYRGAPTILSEQLPQELQGVVEFPEGTRVLGSVLYESSVRIYVVAPEDRSQTREFLRDYFETNEWVSPEAMRISGFVPATRAEPPDVYCSPADSVIYLSAYEWDGRTLIQLSHHGMSETGPCNRPEPHLSELQSRMPVLTAPEGTVRSTGSGGGGRGTWSSSIELETELTPEEVANQTSEQLSDGGWRIDAEGAGAVTIMRSWTHEFDDGLRVHGQLTVLRLESGKYDVSFQMTKLSGR